MRRTLDELLHEARARIERLAPEEALAAAEDGALIVDIRLPVSRPAGRPMRAGMGAPEPLS